MLDEEIKKLQTMRMFGLNQNYIKACTSGNIEKVKFLLHSPLLNKNVNPTVESNKGILSALTFQQYEIVDYLLFADELKGTILLDNNMLILLAYNISSQKNSSFINSNEPSIKLFNKIIIHKDLMDNLFLDEKFLISLDICKNKDVIEMFLYHFENKISEDHIREYLQKKHNTVTTPVYDWLMKLENHKELNAIIIDNKRVSGKKKL